MAEELELDLSQEDENINKTEERIRNLSSKVKAKAQEADEAKRLAEEAANAKAAAEKERDFFKEFSNLTTKYPGANEYQDRILEKVNSGYSHEDAVVAVLNAEGKLPTVERVPIVEQAAGGSASTVIPSGDKSPDQMTQAEKRQMLEEASASGELAQVIRNWGR